MERLSNAEPRLICTACGSAEDVVPKRELCRPCNRRRIALAWYERNKERVYLANKARQQSEAGKAARRVHRDTQRATNPEKLTARRAVNNAIRDGKLFKQPCEVCGAAKVHGHHDDYSRPLDVRWLCRVHHMQAHGKGVLVA